MSEKFRVLLIDIGNTRTKYTTCADDQQLTQTNTLPRSADAGFGKHLAGLLAQCSTVLIASVVQTETHMLVEHIKDYRQAKQRRLGYRVLKVNSDEFGVQCPYPYPNTLGIDRWLTALTVITRTDCAAAIIDAGTAITCDFTHQGRYLGGWISPGLTLLHTSLTTNTAHIQTATKRLTQLALGTTTESCVNNGCLAMAVGLVQGAEAQLRALASSYQIIFSGGDAEQLMTAAQLPQDRATIDQDLVFKGMLLFI